MVLGEQQVPGWGKKAMGSSPGAAEGLGVCSMSCCLPGGHSGAGWLDETTSRAYGGGASGGWSRGARGRTGLAPREGGWLRLRSMN